MTTDNLWNRKALSLSSPDWAEILIIIIIIIIIQVTYIILDLAAAAEAANAEP